MVRSVITERQLWKKLKNESKRISWTRLENWALFGTPDLLGYTPSGNFFPGSLYPGTTACSLVPWLPDPWACRLWTQAWALSLWLEVLRLCAWELVSLSLSFHPPGGVFSLFIFLISFLSFILVNFILDLFDIFRPARAAAAAVVALFRGRADVTSSGLAYHGGPVSPGVAGLGVIFRVA